MSEVIQKKKSFIPPVPLPKESPKSFTPPIIPSKPVAQQPSTESVALKPYSSEKRDLIQKKILENIQAGKFRPSAVDAIQRKCALCEREDAIAIGAGIGYGGRGYPTRGNPFKIPYPVSANELASDDPDVNRFPVTKKPLIGDVISFELGGLNDHTGINLGNEVYISARNSKKRPVWAMQPEDGVQITPIKSNSTHNYRRYSPPGDSRRG